MNLFLIRIMDNWEESFKEKIARKFYSFITFFVIRYYSFRNKIIFREGTSDADVFRQVFIEREYKLPVKISPKLIIDGGANVGYSSLWFAKKFPSAEIIAVEPEESNYRLLQENTKLYKNIKTIKAGIWYKKIFLKIVNLNSGKWGFQTKEVDKNQRYGIQAITIGDILKKAHTKNIDILKLDIEGAEKELFSKNISWLKKVNMIIIEFHDYFRKGCSDSFYSAINKKDWNEFRRGENIMLVRKKSI